MLQVHTASSKMGPIDGGPHGLIHVLRNAIGSSGTLAMPSMTGAECDAAHAS